MKREEAQKKFLKYIGDRTPVFQWKEVEDTNFWFDYKSNSLLCDLGVSVNCDAYTKIWDCIWDFYDAIITYYKQKGIKITDKEQD